MAIRPPQFDAVAELQNAFKVLFSNWVLAIPTALVALLSAIFVVFILAGMMASVAGAGMLGGLHPGAAGALLGAGGLTLVVGLIVLVLLALLANATVVGASERVWHGEPPDLSAGLSKAISRLPALFVLFIIAIIFSIICGLLVIALGLGIILAILLGFFFMYSIPAIVLSNRGAMEALGESYRLVRANLGPSFLAFLGIIVVSIIGQIIITLFHAIPILHVVVTFIVGGLTSAYAALVAVRFYDLLRSGGPPAGTVTTTTTPTI
ncbi:MAG TPA: hypothetical protein VKR99_00115 [Candidatus Eremiobacteraceae bacterium]|nr:hypothetical protein [Candidatus Eremiobacteraceae bacterium]